MVSFEIDTVALSVFTWKWRGVLILVNDDDDLVCCCMLVEEGWCILFSFLLYYTTAACCCCSFCFLPLLLLLLFLNAGIHRLVAGIIIKIIMCIILWWNKSHSCLLFLLFNLQCHCVPWYYGSSIECMLVSSVVFIILRPSTLRS